MLKVVSEALKPLKVILIFGLLIYPFSVAFGEGVKNYDNVLDALKNGTPGVELRASYEVSDLDNNKKATANALTLRTRLSYRTGNLDLAFVKASGFIQFHNLSAIVDQYSNENSKYDVVADPDGNRIHQAYMDIKAFDTTLRAGRQEIIMDDHRLIGNIGWRQNGQSFDAVTLTNKSISGLELFAGYIAQINTVFLTEKDLGGSGLMLAHAKYSGIKGISISVYDYLMDSEETMTGGVKNPDKDFGTVGGRITGKIPFNEDFKVEYEGDYSKQHSYRGGSNYDGYMVNGSFWLNFSGVGIGSGYSKISGQRGDRKPFDTLVSTAHKFNGWSDQFLSTNGGGLTGGLEDIYFQLKAQCKASRTKFLAVYHIFDVANKDTYGGRYGDELNIQTVTKVYDNITLLLKYASYFASNGKDNPAGKDENVFWTRVGYKF